MVNIEQQEVSKEGDEVLCGSLKDGEGFTHLNADYLCIKIKKGHMYCTTGPTEAQQFYNGELDNSRKVRRVDVDYRWSRPE